MDKFKKCKHCQSEILQKATRCSKCSGDLRSFAHRHPILTILLFFVGLVIVLSVFSSPGKYPNNQNTLQKTQGYQQNQVINEIPTKAENSNIKQEIEVLSILESNSDEIIKNHCQLEWPNDSNMKAYCEKQQYDGVRILNQGKPEDIKDTEFNIIRPKCKNEWIDDFNMRAYCEKQQYSAVRILNTQAKPPNISEPQFQRIRLSYENEWPTDFNMRVYCEKQELFN